MTDISKYRNVSLTHDTYKILISLSKVLLPDAKLSISKTIESIANEYAKKLNGKLINKLIKGDYFMSWYFIIQINVKNKENYKDYPKAQEILAQDSADLKEKIELFMGGADEF